MRIVVHVYILILLLFTATLAGTDAVNFEANADRANIATGERAVIVATLSSSKAVSGVPQVAANNTFSVLNVNTGQSQSRNIQLVNGRVEQSVVHTYRYVYSIVSQTDGPFTFPALTVSIDGTDYNTRPLNFNGATAGQGVQGGMGGQGGQAAAAQQSPDIRALLSLSKRTLYIGEQAALTLKIAQKFNSPIQTQRGYARALEQIDNAFSNAFAVNRLFTNQVSQGQENIDGEMYHTFTLKFSVVGLTPGEYTIPAIIFEYDEMQRVDRRRNFNSLFHDFFDMDFFGGGTQAIRRTVRTSPFTVTIRSLPGGAPTGFGGAVGKFTISATADPDTVQAGEAVTLRVNLRGNTRPASIGDPVLPNFLNSDIFPPERQTTIDTGDAGFSTRRTLQYLIIPQEEGILTVDPIIYPFFDPESGTYRTARTNPITLVVTPGKRTPGTAQTRYLTQEEIRQVGHDIRYIKTPARIGHRDSRPYRAAHWYLLFPMPFLFFLFALIYKLQSKQDDGSRSKNMRQKALATAIKELNKAGRDDTDSAFLGKVAIIIEKYISRKLAFPATGRTLEELKDELLSRKIDEQTVTGLTILIENINEYRFGGKMFDTQSRSTMVNRTITFLSSMEKFVKKEKPGKESAAISTSFLLLTIVLPMITTLIFPTTVSATPNANADTAVQTVLLDDISLDVHADMASTDATALTVSAMSNTLTSNASNQNINAWFKAGNESYAANEYDIALAYYKKILDAGIKNSAIYYNIGNCYHRLRKPGPARLYYEKAAVLSPNDADILANINFIKTIIIDRTIDDGHGDSDFLAAAMYNIHTLLPLNIQLITLCALLFALAFFGAAILLKRGLARFWLSYGAVICAILIAVIGTSAGYKIYALETRQYAIIMTPYVDAKNQPAGPQTLFTAHEGTKLRISQTVGDWSFVSLPNGASGWVTTASLGRI